MKVYNTYCIIKYYCYKKKLLINFYCRNKLIIKTMFMPEISSDVDMLFN